MTNVLYNTIKYASYLSLITPFIISRNFLFPFVVPKTLFFWAVAEVIFFAWVLLAIFDKRFRPKNNLLVFAVAIFLLVMFMASLRGVNAEQSFWGPIERMGGMITFLHLGAYFIVLSSVFNTPLKNANINTNIHENGYKEWRRIFRATVLVGILMAGFFLLHEYGLLKTLSQARQGATLGNSSFMGAYLLFPAFMSIYLFLSGSSVSKRLKIFYAAAFMIIFFTLFKSTAWGAFLAFLVGLVLIFVFWLWNSSRAGYYEWRKITAVMLFISMAVAGSIIFYGTFWQKQAITSRLPVFFSGGTINGRVAVWQIAWQGIKERPALGWGLENFPDVFSKYYNSCLGLLRCGWDTLYDRTHNIVFDMLIFGGFMGFLTYLWMFGAAFYLLFKPLINTNKSTNKHEIRRREDWIMPGVMGALLISYLIQNLMVFDMIASYHMFFLTLAFIASKNEISDPRTIKRKA